MVSVVISAPIKEYYMIEVLFDYQLPCTWYLEFLHAHTIQNLKTDSSGDELK